MSAPQSENAGYPDWQYEAKCKGTQHSSLFFAPLHFEGKQARLNRERRAKAICAECPVCLECRDYALRVAEPHGVWGGLSEIERRSVIASIRGGEAVVLSPPLMVAVARQFVSRHAGE